MGSSDKTEAMKQRTKQFALRIIRMFQALPKSEEARVMGRQVLRSGTSVGANYRALCRSRSKAEFISKMNVVVEESDETVFWLELLVEAGIVRERKMIGLMKESNELLAILGSALATAKRKPN